MEKKQQELFEREPPPWEMDDAAEALIAQIYFPDPPFGPWDYTVPESFVDALHPGMRVEVPLGRGDHKLTGYCGRIFSSRQGPDGGRIDPQRLKPILRLVDAETLLAPELVELSQQISDEYLCPLAAVFETVVPPSVRRHAGTRVVQFFSIAEDYRDTWQTLTFPPKQASVLAALQQFGEAVPLGVLRDLAQCTAGPIQALRKRGILTVTSERVRQSAHPIPAVPAEEHITLNPAQAAGLAEIDAHVRSERHATFLIRGITGSGKTEVYIRAIQRVIEAGRQAIVLVPEISLTPQTRQRFRARFSQVAVLHSHLTDAERAWHWQEIRQGRIQVVVGARSAVFAPVPRLGMIVIDEEHDASFKQDTSPRYHAREVARWRTAAARCPLILGSATPSLESWQHVHTGENRLITLPHRVLDRPLPHVGTLDLRSEFRSRQTRGAVSRQLHTAIRQALEAQGQVILLLNRRGFSTSIQCPACGEAVCCPNCAIALTHHREGDKAICHYCDHEIPAPQVCPQCGATSIRFLGFGTQKLEMEVRARFPDARITRMDTDTMRSPGSHERVLGEFRAAKIDILLGTQMIAKGLDFPNVTLVGVVNADTALHLPDFRAAERSFALVTQVAGRTGRGPKGGRVLVQTFCPEHPAIRYATEHDYVAFAEFELRQRREFFYPPISRLVRVVTRSESKMYAHQAADQLVAKIRSQAEAEAFALRLIGPAPAPIEKLRGKFRFHFLIQFDPTLHPQRMIRRALEQVSFDSDVQWIIDVDPLDML